MKAIRFIAAALLCANVVYADANEFAKAKEQGTKALIKYGQKLEKAKNTTMPVVYIRPSFPAKKMLPMYRKP